MKRFADKIITLGKKGTAHARRTAAVEIHDTAILEKLFGDVAERFKSRPGGYTRIIRVGNRVGDNAEMAVIELVERKKATAEGEEKPQAKAEKKSAKAAPKAGKKKASPAEEK